MTIREYILQKFSAFGSITEAELLDMSIAGNFNAEDEYNVNVADAVGKASIHFIEERVFAPRMKTISESGFSASWDYSNIEKYYLMLCRRHGVSTDKTILEQLGVNAIIDKTDIW